MKVVPWKSPNFNERENGEKPSVLVIHFTSMNSTVDALMRAERSVAQIMPPLSEAATRLSKWLAEDFQSVRAAIAKAARERGTTLNQARIDLLTAYHRQHHGGTDE